MGIEVRFVDPENPQNFKDATDENTRAYYGEVLPNPSFKVFPIEEVAELGKPLGIPLIFVYCSTYIFLLLNISLF